MRKILLPLLFLVCFQLSAQQKYQSLLWKISGNDLKKDSYLYGTMHVSSKVAFRLDDVFYKAMANSEVIALESDPTKWLESSYEMLNAYSGYYSHGGDYNKNFYENLVELYFPKRIYIRNAIRLDNQMVNNFLYRKQLGADNFEEETYLDMFIYQAGKKEGKDVIGLEDFKESRYLVAKASYNANKRQIDTWLRKLYDKKSNYRLTEDAYRDRNLDLLDSIGKATNTEHFRQYMLYERNANMVQVLDSVMQHKSVFSGVGAAHLPGKNGMIEMLRDKGYTVTPLTSPKTGFANREKEKLENTFVSPHLKTEKSPDSFISILSFQPLKELNFYNQKYYIATDMANGGYLAITRMNTFEYLNKPENDISLEEIDRLLYEDIPGTILEKTYLETPYPGIKIINKTKKNDFQRYHIYKTPLEIIIVKLGGKKNYAQLHGDKIFKTLSLKNDTQDRTAYIPDYGKYSIELPGNHIAENLEISGKRIVQAFDTDGYYFLQEIPVHETRFIEEDAFEAEYLHTAFYKNLDFKIREGAFGNTEKNRYRSYATVDSVQNRNIYLKSVLKDETYYLLGYIGENKAKADGYFNSFKFKPLRYKKDFDLVKDTALHFTVKSPVKMPMSMMNHYGNAHEKKYHRKDKSTLYTALTNEQIEVKRTKFHDLKMFRNIDSVWSSTTKPYKKDFTFHDQKKSEQDGTHSYSFLLRDSLSTKQIRVKKLLKKGVMYELRSMEDSLGTTSLFKDTFYDTFTITDTLLGRDVFEDKVPDYFKALKSNDSLALNASYLLIFKEKDAKAMMETLKNPDYFKNNEYAQQLLIYELAKFNKPHIDNFLKQLYRDSYADGKVQLNILSAFMKNDKPSGQETVLELLSEDIPVGKYQLNSVFSDRDTLSLRKKMFPELLKYSGIQEYKKPIYSLLAQLKDSGYVKPKSYKNYKTQLLNDAKIELKRGLLDKNTYGNTRYSKSLLGIYVKLLFPYRGEKEMDMFFRRLLNSNDAEALANYYVLLRQNNVPIPGQLRKKTIENDDNLSTVTDALVSAKITPVEFKDSNFQQKYARAKILESTYLHKTEDSLSFHKKTTLELTDKVIDVYYFILENKTSYGNFKYLFSIAFEKEGDILKTKPYYEIKNRTYVMNELKTTEELEQEILEKIRFKNRKRFNKNAYGPDGLLDVVPVHE